MISRRHFTLGLASMMLGACSSRDIVNGIGAAVQGGSIQGAVRSVLSSRLQGWARNPKRMISDLETIDRFTRKFLEDIIQVWGEDSAEAPGDKLYVKYDRNYESRVLINFEKGEVRVESFKRDFLSEAIIIAILSPEDPADIDLFSDKRPKLGGLPFLYEQVLDREGKPIRWRWRAEQFANDVISKGVAQSQIIMDDASKTLYSVVFPLVRTHAANRQNKYAPLVRRYGAEYGQTRALVTAIIEVESSFNPFAVSWVPAYGLMQIVPETAGRDAFEFLYGNKGIPTRNYLFNPENNIRMGCAYLHILDERYLAPIQNPISRKFCKIAAYNGGIGNVWRSFSSNRNRAFIIINQNSPEFVFRRLKSKMQDETKRYLDKVLLAEKKYA